MAKSDSPNVLFNGQWVPAQEVLDKLGTAINVAETIEQFNDRWPELTTEATRNLAPRVHERLKSIESQLYKSKFDWEKLEKAATQFLETLGPEETLEEIEKEFGQQMDLQALVTITGTGVYRRSLVREITEFRRNKISPEQTATLWNELGRPTLGGGSWTASKVEELSA